MTNTPDSPILLCGRPVAADPPLLLTAGPLQLHLVEGELRYLTVGGVEAVRRIYAAVRDRFWNTIPGAMSGFSVERTGGGFCAGWESVHANGDVDFAWRSTIAGRADGTVRWEFDGVARRAFRRNRIGFCVLHPLDTCRNRPCIVEHVSGEVAERKFPDTIAPDQPVRGLHDFRAMQYALGDGLAVRIAFEGDVFEMEDQRNWTDASFKTYSTPQRIPLPAEVPEGTRVRQVVTVSLVREAGVALPPAVTSPLRLAGIVVDDAPARPLPPIGLGPASHGRPLTDRECDRLRDLSPAHLRVDIKPSSPNWRETLAAAGHDAARTGAALEIALHLPTQGAREAVAAAAAAAEPLPVVRWLVLEEGRPVASPALLEFARERLRRPGSAVGVGTDIDYFQLNNNRPAPESADFLFCSIRPQAHNFDDAAIVENLAGQEDLVDSVRADFGAIPFVVSPVTLRRRWFKGPPPPEGELPPTVDPRQLSLAAAGWLTGSLRALAQAGAAGITFFETTGWQGVMESEAGSPLPAKFPSQPAGVFPVYHVLRALADFRGGEVVPVRLTDPLALQALLVRKPGARRLILANVTPRSLPVTCQGTAGNWLVRILDARAAAAATHDPVRFHTAPPTPWDGRALELPPAALAFADQPTP